MFDSIGLLLVHSLLQKKDNLRLFLHSELGSSISYYSRGDLESLLEECRSIQEHLKSAVLYSADSSGKFARRFAKLMMEGKL